MAKRRGGEVPGGHRQAALKFSSDSPEKPRKKQKKQKDIEPPLSGDTNPGYEELDRSEAESATGAGIGPRDVVEDTVEANLRRINKGRPSNG